MIPNQARTMKMKLMSSTIRLEQLRFHAYHGVLPQERKTGNDYVVNLSIGYDFSPAMLSDEVSDTLNYAEVYQLVEQEMAVPSNLLERVAGRICDRLNRRFAGINDIKLRITKVNPPMGADCQGASVEVHLASLNK